MKRAVVTGGGFGGSAVRIGARGPRSAAARRGHASGRARVFREERLTDHTRPTLEMRHRTFDVRFRTVYGLVSKFVKNDCLRQVYSLSSLLVRGNRLVSVSVSARVVPDA